jgi:hypothetical protein
MIEWVMTAFIVVECVRLRNEVKGLAWSPDGRP